MLANAVVNGLRRLISQNLEATRHRFPKPDAWRSLDNDAVWKLVVYQVAVVGGSSSYDRLVHSAKAQEALRYDRLRVASSEERVQAIHTTLRECGVRYASADIQRCPKTRALARNLEFLAKHPGGPSGYLKDLSLLQEDARVARVMRDLSYIKLKGARDLLAELGLVREVIALDARILGILRELGADAPADTPSNQAEYEALQSALLTQVCQPMGITGVEFDRVLYWSRDPTGRAQAT